MYLIYIFLEKLILDQLDRDVSMCFVDQHRYNVSVGLVLPKFVVHPCAILIYD